MLKIVESIKSGWHSGKANKLLKNGNYNEALRYYELALKSTDNIGGRASLLECAAKSALLSGNQEKAILYLKESLSIYHKFKDSNSLFNDSFLRVKSNLNEIKMEKERKNGIKP